MFWVLSLPLTTQRWTTESRLWLSLKRRRRAVELLRSLRLRPRPQVEQLHAADGGHQRLRLDVVFDVYDATHRSNQSGRSRQSHAKVCSRRLELMFNWSSSWFAQTTRSQHTEGQCFPEEAQVSWLYFSCTKKMEHLWQCLTGSNYSRKSMRTVV